MKDTKIEWAHSTFNPWWGCEKVSPGCAHCYAETFAKRTGHGVWGDAAPRRFFGDKHWAEPLNWDRAARGAGERHRVFCASMADVFEDRPDLVAPRRRLFDLIDSTPSLDWLLLTKRPQNIGRLAAPWCVENGALHNVWLGTTVEDQQRADERIPHLLRVPATVRFLSVEPLLGPVDLTRVRFPHGGTENVLRTAVSQAARDAGIQKLNGIDWVIVGGESGSGARPCDVAWIRSVVRQCSEAGVACFVKQLGARPLERNDSILDSWPGADKDDLIADDSYEPRYQGELVTLRLRDRKGGDPAEWPADLRVRELPEARS